MNDNSCCIGNVLEVIDVLQCQAEKIDDIPNTCDRPFLGNVSSTSAYVYNTRPVTLYTSENKLIEAPYTLGDVNSKSSVFRVEKVTGGTVTLRALAENSDEDSAFPYVKTDSFIIVNCNCICAISCLSDTFIDCI